MNHLENGAECPRSTAVQLAGINLDNPLVLASGIMGLSASSLARTARNGAAAVTTKSCGLEERKGHPCPALLPFEHGLLNAIGLANPGVEVMAEEILEFRNRSSVPVIASIFGANIDDFPEAAAIIAKSRPDMIEINVSCPNVSSEFGTSFASDPDMVGEITSKTRKKTDSNIPISVKISLQCTSISRVAAACEYNGADAITAINSVGPGMIIDTDVRRPVLANLAGGLSGPAILPLAVRAVWDISRTVSIPIIATGGVETANDALQLIMAGATAIGIGTAVYRHGIGVFDQINRDITAFLAKRNISALSELRGTAHV